MTVVEHLYLVPLLLWVIFAAGACYGLYDCVTTLKPAPPIDWHPNIVLIIPVRHVPPNFFALWDAICAQTLQPARVIFAVEDLDDPAAAAAASFQGGPPVEVVPSGATTRRAQKVNNLIAALATLRPEDEVIVFADADIIPKPDWIQRLAVPLKNPDIFAVTGYRWMTPLDESWASAVVCVANAAVATLPRSGRWNFSWGGSTALRRDTFEAIKLTERWKDLVLDDIPFTQAIAAHGGHITSPQSFLVPSPIAWDWATAIAFGRRQYLLVRWFSPGLWALAAMAATVPLIGWLVAIPYALSGDGFAIAAFIVANGFDQVRASLRARVPRIIWNEEMPRRMALVDRFGTPFTLAFHAAIIWSTMLSHSITWGGRTYTVDPNGKVLHIDVHSA